MTDICVEMAESTPITTTNSGSAPRQKFASARIRSEYRLRKRPLPHAPKAANELFLRANSIVPAQVNRIVELLEVKR